MAKGKEWLSERVGSELMQIFLYGVSPRVNDILCFLGFPSLTYSEGRIARDEQLLQECAWPQRRTISPGGHGHSSRPSGRPARHVLWLMLSQTHQVNSSLMTGSALCCCLILTRPSLRKDLGKQDNRSCRSFGVEQTWVRNKTPVTLNDWLTLTGSQFLFQKQETAWPVSSACCGEEMTKPSIVCGCKGI